MFDLCREGVRKPLLIHLLGKFLLVHLLDQGEHLSSVLGLLDLASLCSNGKNGQKANCQS